MSALPAVLSMSNHRAEKDFFADLLLFGDARVLPLEKIYDYYRLNVQQVKTVNWLQENLIPVYADRKNLDINLLKGSVSFHRVGIIPGSELLICACMVFRLDVPKMLLLETRFIEVGKKGGRRLINPKYAKTYTGDWVLKVDVK